MLNKISKILLIVVVLIIATFIIITIETYKRIPEIKNPIKIGATMPMTGDLAYFGKSYSSGAELAIEEINAQGGINGRPLKLIIYDNGFNAKNAVTDFRMLVDIDKTQIILAPMTPISLALKSLADKEKIIILSQTITPVGSEYMFKDFYGMEQLGKSMSNAILNTKTDKLCIFALNTADGQTLVDVLKKNYVKNGGSIALLEMTPYISGAYDFRTLLAKAKNVNCNGIYAFQFPNTQIRLIKQMGEMGLTDINFFSVQIQDPVVMEKPDIKKILGTFNLTLSSWFSVNINNNKNYLGFKKRYIKKFGYEPKGDTAYTYDDIKLIAKIMNSCDNDDNLYNAKGLINTACIRKKLLAIKDYDGAAGILSFDGTTNSTRDVYIEEYKNKLWIPFHKRIINRNE